MKSENIYKIKFYYRSRRCLVSRRCGKKINFCKIFIKTYLNYLISNIKAIDEIFMSDKNCPVPSNCDFEDPFFDFCSWRNLENKFDDFDWEIYSPTLVASHLNFGPQIADNTFKDLNG